MGYPSKRESTFQGKWPPLLSEQTHGSDTLRKQVDNSQLILFCQSFSSSLHRNTFLFL